MGGASSINMMRMLIPISTCDRMEVTRVSLTFTTLQGGRECGNEPLEFNDEDVEEESIEHGCGDVGQHEHDEDAQPDQHGRQNGGHAGLPHLYHPAEGNRMW